MPDSSEPSEPVTLAVTVICYNDAATLPGLLLETERVVRSLTARFVLLAIDDGSTDGTAKVLESFRGQIRDFTWRRHPDNEGFGPTIREAFLEPDAEWVTFLPGDAQIPPRSLEAMFRKTATHDAIIGLRARRRDHWRRRLASRVYNGMLSLVAGRRLRDTNSILLVRRSILDPERIRGTSAFVQAEVLLAALAAGARYTEVPIEHEPRRHGAGAGNRLAVILPTIRDLLRYTFHRR